MSGPGKLASLLSLLGSRPQEFRDRVAMLLDVRLEGLRSRRGGPAAGDGPGALARLDALAPRPLSAFLREPELARFADEMRGRMAELRHETAISAAHNADLRLARFCYAACRALEPAVVVETGVAYGVTSAFVLKALSVNGRGLLHSVDLPPLGRDAGRVVGALVPEELRGRWRLHRGVSWRLLPGLIDGLGSVDLFVHDSLHTFRNMRRELDIVTPRLSRPSMVVADDVGGNEAFASWCAAVEPALASVVAEEDKDASFGFSLLL